MPGKEKNLALIHKQVPSGFPKPGEDLVVEDVGYDFSAELPDNTVSIEVLYLSLDPYLRGRMRSAEVKSYFPAFELGAPIGNHGVGRVLKSASSEFKEGDLVLGGFPFQQYVTFELPGSPTPLQKLPADGPEDVRNWLGALGMPGLTAYSSLYEIGKPKKGETIFISSAAGAVGQLVGQIAKHDGLKVIGSVGSAEKLSYIIDELGFDAGFNYKDEKPADALKRLAPDGIDIYFENVGGDHLTAAINALNNHGRIVACGMISQYNVKPDQAYGVQNLMQVVGKRLTMTGFIVSDKDFGPKWGAEHREKVSQWLKKGEFKAKVHEWVGMEEAGNAMVGMLKGENFGKAVLKVKV